MVGTLLGPEGTTVGCLSVAVGGRWARRAARHGLGAYRSRVRGAGVSWWVVGWLWVENCTVDASILFSVVCFVWLSCQGRTVDALAPGADEGRGRPR
jgi:hypothetical protein